MELKLLAQKPFPATSSISPLILLFYALMLSLFHDTDLLFIRLSSIEVALTLSTAFDSVD